MDAATQPDAKSDTEQLIGELNAISGLCTRARRRLLDGAVQLARRRLRRACRAVELGLNGYAIDALLLPIALEPSCTTSDADLAFESGRCDETTELGWFGRTQAPVLLTAVAAT